MSDQTIKSISNATGTFRSPISGASPRAQTGNAEVDSGKSLPAESVSKDDLAKIAKILNMGPKSIGRNLRFEVDLEAGRSVIQVLDRDTGEIIRQIPPEEVTTYLEGEGDLALRLYDERV